MKITFIVVILCCVLVMGCASLHKPIRPPKGMTWTEVRERYLDLKSQTLSEETRKEMRSLLRLYYARVWEQPVATRRFRSVVENTAGEALPDSHLDITLMNIVKPWSTEAYNGIRRELQSPEGQFDVRFDHHRIVEMVFWRSGYWGEVVTYDFVQPRPFERNMQFAEELLMREQVLPLDNEAIGFRIILRPRSP